LKEISNENEKGYFNIGNTEVLRTQNCELDCRAEYSEIKYVEVHIIIAKIYWANLFFKYLK